MDNINCHEQLNDHMTLKQTRDALILKYESQSLLLEISQNFTKAACEDIDDTIDLTLRQIGEFDDDDRSYVFFFSKDECLVSNTHEWCREGITPQIDNLQNYPTEGLIWWIKKLKDYENIVIPSVNGMPPEAQAEKELLLAQDIQSLLVVPIISEKKLIGFLGFDSVRKGKNWPDDTIALLNIVANIIANALERKDKIKALRESENYYRTIFENTGAATCIIEEDMTISKANGEWEKYFGFTKQDLEGANWEDLFYAKPKDYVPFNLVGPTINKRFNAQIKNKTGKPKDCLITADLIPGTKKYVVNHIDLSEFNRINRALQAVSAINYIMLRADNEQKLLKNVCQKIVKIGNYRMAWVGFMNHAGEGPFQPVAFAGYEKGYLNAVKRYFEDEDRDKRPIGIVLSCGKPFICRNLETDPIFVPWRDEVIKRGYKASIYIPIIINDLVAGVLSIYSGEENSFDKDEVNLLTEMAGELSYGIRSLRIRKERDMAIKELELSLEKMHRILKQTVNSLATSLETRDPYTAGHQKRVAWLAVEIAQEMGLNAEQIAGLAVAGSLHDIGKVVVPLEILRKPGGLSEYEYAIIKDHSQAGFSILKDIEFPWPVSDIVLQHHERIDGSGYPQGLAGDQIMIEAKILAVADAMETMSSHRPYRAAIGIDEALEEIIRNKGILFEPAVVDCCIRLFKEKGLSFD